MAKTTIFKFNSEEDRAKAALATVTYRRRGHGMLTGTRGIALSGDEYLPAYRAAITRAVGEGNFVETTP